MGEVVREVRLGYRTVKRRRGRVRVELARFYSSPSAKDPDLEAACGHDELKLAAKEFGGEVHFEGRRVEVREDHLYERLMVYAAVRQSLRRPSLALDLREAVAKLGLYELHFWASTFAEAYRARRSRAALFRPAKAFKVLHGLAR